MSINARPYEERDKTLCAGMMRAEGYRKKQMFFDAYSTWVFEKDEKVAGFLTVNFQRRIPHLVHFITDREHRDFKTGWRMLRYLKSIMVESGHTQFTLDCPVREIKRGRMLQGLFKTRPYSTKNGNHFYLVNIGGDRRG